MNIAFIISAVVTVIPTLTLGYANGITALGGFLMLLTGLAIHSRNRANK